LKTSEFDAEIFPPDFWEQAQALLSSREQNFVAQGAAGMSGAEIQEIADPYVFWNRDGEPWPR
jgi:hypothetical protein